VKYFETDVIKCALFLAAGGPHSGAATCPSAKRVALPHVICRDETRWDGTGRDGTGRDGMRRNETRRDETRREMGQEEREHIEKDD